uniref:TPX2 C-terminal domain-containing protein n=1 Tax=Kalanchoe fedtschenkoi TaxID=63787 RepID=A0A7N1A354_KALFE
MYQQNRIIHYINSKLIEVNAVSSASFRDTIIMNYQQAKSPQKKFLKSSSSQSSVEWSATAGRDMAASRKSPTKEFSKPADIKLHTQDRALKRAMFNYAVATRLNQLQQRKKEEEKLQKILEEKEVRMLRKEMVPKAQLMPLFDRPFFPQRSNRPLTIPKEPSFYANIHGKYWNSNQFHHTFQPYHAMRPIK